MKKYITFKTGFITLLTINMLIIAANYIYVTPPINNTTLPLPEGKTNDVKEIMALEKLSAAGWAAGDGEMLASVYTDRADYVTFNGEWLQSKKEIDLVHQDLFDGVLKGSSIENREVRSIRFITDSVALVHMTGAVKHKGRKRPAKSRASIQTLVALKTAGEWKFTAFHNARISRISLWEGIKMSFN
ncbi:SgcJ/EcaC family oxidoreductase [Olivibacter sp. SDN3]|uniref:SgcJ/EcaC family oxidoreductase n=1 Tax=Olivibacter sp. SDN3 TaxID=2764720 RepID=UPI001650F764|nr:SgcJ/EcaC family oxidoreductase [Olivibacter sp. SDN3]QNL48208.1 SgcJ/EcaC family oxidoreductase [Olivibacter sp. SDN3]